MFNLMEPVLFVHKQVTIQPTEPVHSRVGSCFIRRGHDAGTDNLVYKDGVEWALIRDNWVLTQITEESLEALLRTEEAYFQNKGYIPFTVLPFAAWAPFAYRSFIADPKAFVATLNQIKVLTLRAELATLEARMSKPNKDQKRKL